MSVEKVEEAERVEPEAVTDNDAVELANPFVYATLSGWELLWPFPGARIRFRTRSGRVVSYGVASALAHEAALSAWSCSVCGTHDRPEEHRQRDLRLDARYCSNACRQRAYRRRRRAA